MQPNSPLQATAKSAPRLSAKPFGPAAIRNAARLGAHMQDREVGRGSQLVLILLGTAFGGIAVGGPVWAQPATLSGTIRYAGTRGVVSPTRPIRLVLFRSFGEDPVADAVVTSNGGSYQIEAPSTGTYYLGYFLDLDDDGRPLGEPVELYSNQFKQPGDPIIVPQAGIALDFDDTLIFEESEREYRLNVQGIANGWHGFVVFAIYSNNLRREAELFYEDFGVVGEGGSTPGVEFILPAARHSPPLKYLPPGLGQTWGDTEDWNGYRTESHATVLTVNDTVTVAAGSFTGCVKVEEALTYPFGYPPGQLYRTLYRRWFAPGVGPVKLQMVNSDGTEEDGELTSYSTPGAAATDYFPLAANYSWVFRMVATGRSVDVWVESPTGSTTPTSTVSLTLTRTATATRTPTPSPTFTQTRSMTATPTVTPTQHVTFPGDANCNSRLDTDDVTATVTAVFDPIARALCDADCNQDDVVTAADMTCVVTLLAGRR